MLYEAIKQHGYWILGIEYKTNQIFVARIRNGRIDRRTYRPFNNFTLAEPYFNNKMKCQ